VPAIATLTAREFEVLKCVIAGTLNKRIASQRGTTEGTIKIHRGRVMEKMGATSVAELVILAQKAGIAPASADATKV
jgi:FixJ family two-component response regulator